MWKITETREVRQQLKAYFDSGAITRDDVVVIKKWMQDMERLGPDVLLQNGKYDDHHLDDDWAGYRSACFSPSGRIIYSVHEEKIVVKVIRITPDHDYTRR